VATVTGDIRSRDGCQAIIDAVLARHGRLTCS